MIQEIIDHVLAALKAADIPATADVRNISAPGCFVTVTKLVADVALSGNYTGEGTITCVVKDLGGLQDIKNLSGLADKVIPALHAANVWVKTVDTNHQATPPTGGTLPAIRINYEVAL